MTLFQYLNEHIDVVKHDVKIGLFPCSILRHYEMYSRYDLYRKNGHDYHKAFLFLIYDYDLSERTVYRIIKQMETEV
jgi:Mor family transcriptional regulator